jgi:two-component system chemotaxis sensor kinase CheA
MDMDDALQTFFAECRELLQDMEDALLRVEQEVDQSDSIGAIFRAAHTIKGSAGLFGLDGIVAFTHVVESVLDRVRQGEVAISGELVAAFLDSCDHIGNLVESVAAEKSEPDDATRQAGQSLLSGLETYLVKSTSNVAAKTAETGKVVAIDAHWHISLRFGRDVFRNGFDPLSFIRYLATLGRIVHVETLIDALPEAAEMDAESCYLGFEIGFVGQVDKQAVENVFEFVRDDCAIRILPPGSMVSDFTRLIRELPEDDARVGEILVACGTLTRRELGEALQIQSGDPVGAVRQIGQILVDGGNVRPAVVDAAVEKQQQVKDRKVQESNFIRVDADKLDAFINLVGELVIAGASTGLLAQRSGLSELIESSSTLSRLVDEVRDSALQLRMVQIGGTFNRFQRVVRDVSKEIGKEIELVIAGAETELDKTVVEKIADPLMHLVRNAMDHGIEQAEVRAARGKPARGTLKLNAYHDSGSIVIEVSDDGGGLKRDRILAKGIERGLVQSGQVLSDSEIFGLVFEAGFSTAEKITNLSGRGVGMDVVKRNITALRGTVGITSTEGAGTTVSVRLPLTLAIIDGFLVGLDKSVFVVPLDMIEECVEFNPEPGHEYTSLRGEVLPFMRLREMFEVEGTPPKRQSIVVVRHAGKRSGLVVDTLLGEFQTVIKPLGKMFSHIRCISGSTILGTGEVALILDVPALVRQVEAAHDRKYKSEQAAALDAEAL